MDMGKIVYPSSSSSSKHARVEQSERSFQLKRHKPTKQPDNFNKLPDELLCYIISRLTLIEAARTSVLAHRWKTLWYHFRGALEFNETKRIQDLLPEAGLEANTQTEHDYLSSNRQILQSLQSPCFDAFKVRCFNTDGFCESYLDFCVQFAMKKRVKAFELDAYPMSFVSLKFEYYKLPLEFNAWIKKTCGVDGNISSLMSIALKGVTVSDDLIHQILVNCPLLENLCVRDSLELFNPKFTGATTKLKYLEIWGLHMESIEICAPNLLTFSTGCKKVKLFIKNAPKLVELSIPVHIVQNSPESVSSYLPHLEKLTWVFLSNNHEFDICLMHRFAEQNKLQHLTWKLRHYFDRYSIHLNSLLEASPFLHKFTLVNYYKSQRTRVLVPTVTAKHPHQCLKVLEIYGFTSSDAQIKLVRYFLANTTSLEKIILDTISPIKREMGILEPMGLSESALELKKYLPSRVSLVIL